MENKSPNKLEIFNSLLTKGSVFVHCDGTQCTFLPNHLLKQEQVVLQFGLNMAIPIPDLLATEQGVHGTLSFKGKPEYVMVPWYSVFALVAEDGKGSLVDWLPDSVRNKMNAEAASKPVAEPKPKVHDYRNLNKPTAAKRPNHLRLVK